MVSETDLQHGREVLLTSTLPKSGKKHLQILARQLLHE